MNTDLYSYHAKDIHGEGISMADFKEKAVLQVNTSSKCSFIPQYEELEQLFEDKIKRSVQPALESPLRCSVR